MVNVNVAACIGETYDSWWQIFLYFLYKNNSTSFSLREFQTMLGEHLPRTIADVFPIGDSISAVSRGTSQKHRVLYHIIMRLGRS